MSGCAYVEKVKLLLGVEVELKKGKTKADIDKSRQALLRSRLKEVVVAAVVQQGVDTCRHERLTSVLKVGRSVAL